MPTDSQLDQPKLSRGDAIKLGIVGAAGALLTACGLKSSPTETPAPSPTVPATPERPTYQSDLIVTGEENKNIWQEEINSSNPTLLQAVESVAPGETWSGYALSLIKADRQQAVIFSGPSGRGKKAILVVDNLFRDGKLNDLPPYINPSNCSNGDAVVFGNTKVVEENFKQLVRENNPLASLKEYLNVTLEYNQENQQQTLTINQLKRLSSGDADYSPGLKEWTGAQVKQFTGDLNGNWQ